MLKLLDLGLIYDHYWEEPIIPSSWTRLPCKNLENRYEFIISKYIMDDQESKYIAQKIENTCKKTLMMWYGRERAIKAEEEFMATQSRDMPALIWDSEIKILYNIEAMILLGRSVLDLAANFSSNLMLDRRMDSFHDFYNIVKKGSTPQMSILKQFLTEETLKTVGWVNLVCSLEGKRSERDKIAHQTVIDIGYIPTRPKGENRYCHIFIDENEIPLEKFVDEFCFGITKFLEVIEDTLLN